MSASEQLNDAVALKGAIKSEMSMIRVYTRNEERWRKEYERESAKLERQIERVKRLREYRENGLDMLEQYAARVEELNKKIALLKNKAAIEKLLNMQRQLTGISQDVDMDVLSRVIAAREEGKGE